MHSDALGTVLYVVRERVRTNYTVSYSSVVPSVRLRLYINYYILIQFISIYN